MRMLWSLSPHPMASPSFLVVPHRKCIAASEGSCFLQFAFYSNLNAAVILSRKCFPVFLSQISEYVLGSKIQNWKTLRWKQTFSIWKMSFSVRLANAVRTIRNGYRFRVLMIFKLRKRNDTKVQYKTVLFVLNVLLEKDCVVEFASEI